MEMNIFQSTDRTYMQEELLLALQPVKIMKFGQSVIVNTPVTLSIPILSAFYHLHPFWFFMSIFFSEFFIFIFRGQTIIGTTIGITSTQVSTTCKLCLSVCMGMFGGGEVRGSRYR